MIKYKFYNILEFLIIKKLNKQIYILCDISQKINIFQIQIYHSPKFIFPAFTSNIHSFKQFKKNENKTKPIEII